MTVLRKSVWMYVSVLYLVIYYNRTLNTYTMMIVEANSSEDAKKKSGVEECDIENVMLIENLRPGITQWQYVTSPLSGTM